MIDTDNSYIPLDLWGGNNSFNIKTNSFILNRPYGLFSNITVAIYGIAKLKTLGYNVNNIELYLSEYANNYNFYPHLFNSCIDKSIDIITNEEAYSLINTIHPTSHGLSRGWNTFVKEDLTKVQYILSKIYNVYFNINQYVKTYYENITHLYNISFQDSAFIWARKTDKTNETNIPTANTYYNTLNQLSNNINHIFIQTDDASVVEDFLSINDSRISILNFIPVSTTNKGFHERLYLIEEQDFLNTYGCSKITYLQQILAMVNVAKDCKYFVSYPGNLTTVIPMLRGSFDNCILFKNAYEII